MRRFSINKLALVMFSLNPILWASFYSTGRWSLETLDPFGFSMAELLVAAFPAAIIFFFSRQRLNRVAARRGVFLGVILYSGVFTSTLALVFTTATDTAFYPAANGVLAALISWLFLRRPVGRASWIAGAFTMAGMALLISQTIGAGGTVVGDLIAIAAAILYTIYIFCSEAGTRDSESLWVIFSVELLTLAVLAVIVGITARAIWPEFARPLLPALDGQWLVVIYAGLATTFLPTAISIFFQRHTDPVTVAFLYVLEPVWGALIAHIWLGETLTTAGYLGGGLIVAGATWRTIAETRMYRNQYVLTSGVSH